MVENIRNRNKQKMTIQLVCSDMHTVRRNNVLISNFVNISRTAIQII